jgi:hypothetical protein
VETIPLKTLEFIQKYAREGGHVLFLERLPEKSTGLNNAEESDAKIKAIVDRFFNEPSETKSPLSTLYGLNEPKRNDSGLGHSYGKGKVYLLNNVIDRQIWWNKQSSMLDPFLKILRTRIAPDFGIDFAYEGMRKNQGLTYLHRKVGESDFYFVANIQDRSSSIPVTFRVKNKKIRKWDPFTGKISQVVCFEETNGGIRVPLNLAPYESCFLEFAPGAPEKYVSKSDFLEITGITSNTVMAESPENGSFRTVIHAMDGNRTCTSVIAGIPASFSISGEWQMELKGKDFPVYRKTTDQLTSWSDNPVTKNFSGTGRYSIDFTLPKEYLRSDQKIYLDLGRVGNVAEVAINGKQSGIVWMRDQKPEVSGALNEGNNHLDILVTNTLINRIANMEKAAPIPADLISRYGSKDKMTEVPREFGFSPLPAAGLLGPVRLIPVRKVVINL